MFDPSTTDSKLKHFVFYSFYYASFILVAAMDMYSNTTIEVNILFELIYRN